MGRSPAGVRPAWVSDDLFPFESRFFPTARGHTMHYVDEGAGEPIVFVHGNPAWSFEFRHLIGGLRSEFRCVAPDHIGFGLSSRSDRRGDHHPATHAEVFGALLDELELRDVTLFLTDWGGPIGLDFARRHPDRVKRLVVANTWCWPVNRDLHFWFFSRMMASPLGQHLIKRRNFFVNGVMPIRERIVDDPAGWESAVGDADFVEEFDLTGESLKRPPKGFDPEHPLVEDLKRKDHVATCPFDEEEATAPGFIDCFADACRTSSRYMEFLTRAVGLPY